MGLFETTMPPVKAEPYHTTHRAMDKMIDLTKHGLICSESSTANGVSVGCITGVTHAQVSTGLGG